MSRVCHRSKDIWRWELKLRESLVFPMLAGRLDPCRPQVNALEAAVSHGTRVSEMQPLVANWHT